MDSKWLIRLSLAAVTALSGYLIYDSQSVSDETKYAFAINHPFADPVVFYGGKGLRYEKDPRDARLLKIYLPPQNLSTPLYLLVEDGELDFLGFVKKDELFIPLHLFQIHDDRPGLPEAPVSECKTYLEVKSTADTILVLVDNKYVLRGTKAGEHLYAIPFCETTREHQFQTLGIDGKLASKGAGPAPATYSLMAMGPVSQPRGTYNYQIRYPGDTVRMAAYSPMMYSTTGSALAQPLATQAKTATTKVTFSMPRQVQSPWVYLNDKRLKDFTLNSARNQVTFYVAQSSQAIKVRVGDSNCECQASGYPTRSTLELAGYCECRDIQVTVQLDPGLERYRNKIRIYIDGQLTDLPLPPAGQPFAFPVRKTDRDQQVALKLLMVDDTGHTGLIDVCNFTVPQEVTTANLNPDCHCAECPPNIKISG